MKKVSVIIPVYNVELYLDECMKSVTNQTYRELEIIAIDDGSTDKSGCILDEWAQKDSRIRVIHRKNGGLSVARNAGLDMATGDYVAMIDSDDFWDVDAVENLVALANDNRADMVIARGRKVDSKGNEFCDNIKGAGKHPEGVISEEEFWKERVSDMFFVVAWSKLYRKELFENVRFPEGRINEDVAVLWKIVSRCKTIYATRRKIYNWRITQGSISRSKFGYRNLYLPIALLEEVEYIKNTVISESVKSLILKNAFSQTSVILAKAFNYLGEPCQIKEADEIYLKYKPIAKELRRRAELSEKGSLFIKVQMTIYLASKSGYFAIRKIKGSEK